MANRLAIEVKLNQYERDGDEKYEAGAIIVQSHWNRDEMVVLCVPGAKSVTVLASDLESAIRRASR